MLAEGMSDREMAGELAITLKDLRNLKRELMNNELEEIAAATPGEVWARYRIRMDGCINDLDTIVALGSDVKVRGGLQAATSAIKAKAAILESVLKKGQELGVIHKEPEKSVVISGIAVTSAGLEDLREMLAERKAGVRSIVERYAPKELVDYTLESEGDIYADPSAESIPARRKATA